MIVANDEEDFLKKVEALLQNIKKSRNSIDEGSDL